MKQIILSIISILLLASCQKTETAPDPKYYDGVTLGVTVHKTVPSNLTDTTNDGTVMLQVNGTTGNGQVITTQVNFSDANHVAFTVVVRSIDFEANEYDFTLSVPAGTNQIDTVFNAGGRIQVLALGKISQ